MNALVGEIATAIHEQSGGITQPTASISQIDQVTQDNASSAEHAASAAQALQAHAVLMESQMKDLQQLIGSTHDTGERELAHPVRTTTLNPRPRTTSASSR